MVDVEMKHRRLRAIWLGGAVAVSVILMLATIGDQFRPWDPYVVAFVFGTLTFGAENNVGAAWSGVLLMLLAVHAFDGYARHAGSDSAAARGWACIALLLLALSADEIGSFHERTGLYGDPLGIGVWVARLPFAVIFGGMLVYGLVMLARSRSERSKVPYLLLGFVLMSSAALQEVVEHRVEWPTAGARALRMALEEGSEVGGMLIILTQVAGNTAALSTTSGPGAGPAFEAVGRLRWPLVALALALTPLFAYVTVGLEDARGRVASWAAALLFVAAGLAVCRPFFATRAGFGWDRWFLCGLCALAVLAVVDVYPGKVVGLGPLDVNVKLFIMGAIALMACAIVLMRSHGDFARPNLIAVSVSAAFAAALLWASVSGPLSHFMVHVLSQLAAVATFVAIVAGTETLTAALPHRLKTGPRSSG